MLVLAPWLRAQALAAAVYLSWSTGPRGRVCHPHAASKTRNFVSFRGEDRTRQCWRWSVALRSTLPGDANQAQGNPTSMPQNKVW